MATDDECVRIFAQLSLPAKRRALESVTDDDDMLDGVVLSESIVASPNWEVDDKKCSDLPLPMELFRIINHLLCFDANALRNLYCASILLSYGLPPLEESLDRTRVKLPWFRRFLYRLHAHKPDYIFRFQPRSVLSTSSVAVLLGRRRDAGAFAKPERVLYICKYSMMMFRDCRDNACLHPRIPIYVDAPEVYLQANGRMRLNKLSDLPAFATEKARFDEAVAIERQRRETLQNQRFRHLIVSTQLTWVANTPFDDPQAKDYLI